MLYTAIIRPTITYGFEVWTTKTVTESRLRTFKNILCLIRGPIRNTKTKRRGERSSTSLEL